MERKEYIKLAATKAKTLNNGQMIRITANERYFIMRDKDGKLYIGQALNMGIEGETTKGEPFFAGRQEYTQQRTSDNKIIGYWQRFMPTKGEQIAHGYYPGSGYKGV
jgi:hypothetical protein